MTEENRIYITHLKVTDVPWHRLTTAYGRGTDFPAHLAVLEQMRDLEAVKESLYELTTNMEHQGTLWHATPFGMVFLSRILGKALKESGRNPVAHFLAGELLDFFACILQCFRDGDEMEHAEPLPQFSDLLREEYLWWKNTTRKRMRCATRRTRFSPQTSFTASIMTPGSRWKPTGIYWSKSRQSLPSPPPRCWNCCKGGHADV